MRTSREIVRATGAYAAAAMLLVLLLIPGAAQSAGPAQPYTFYFTHYELIGDPNKPEGVRYHSNGQPFAKDRKGDTLALSGKGAWDPRNRRAVGGGTYTVKNSKGTVTAEGMWSVSDFISFQQMSGWWEQGFKELGWQGPPGSVSFSGFLTLTVNLQKQGNAVLVAWCLMPTVAMPGDHKGDGIMVVGPSLTFTDYKDTEESAEGVMFYSTDPASAGYMLDAQGRTFLKKP
jgi:hypothetical protein